jgi:drug/metabolite transporter (DMT)-like permease
MMPHTPSEPSSAVASTSETVRAERPVSRLLPSLTLPPGLLAALISPLFLGTIPILAKLAYAAHVDVFTVVALRTTFAAVVLWVSVLGFGRKYLQVSSPALIGSLIAGSINGLGSILFYSSLLLITASLGQLINITYLIFVTVLLRIGGQQVSWLTFGRVLLAIAAILLLTVGGLGPPNWLGVGMMALAAFSYAVQLVMGQRILFEIPPATMTLYAISAMALVVDITWLIVQPPLDKIQSSGWEAVLLMGVVTALSRLTLFMGVKHLGSIQTALFGVTEVLISIFLAIILLGEHLTPVQWIGALIIVVSVLLVKYERNVPRFVDIWPLIYRLMKGLRLGR